MGLPGENQGMVVVVVVLIICDTKLNKLNMFIHPDAQYIYIYIFIVISLYIFILYTYMYIYLKHDMI